MNFCYYKYNTNNNNNKYNRIKNNEYNYLSSDIICLINGHGLSNGNLIL